MASEAISECLILKNFRGEHASRPPYLVHSQRMQWPYQSKIVGAGPEGVVIRSRLLIATGFFHFSRTGSIQTSRDLGMEHS